VVYIQLDVRIKPLLGTSLLQARCVDGGSLGRRSSMGAMYRMVGAPAGSLALGGVGGPGSTAGALVSRGGAVAAGSSALDRTSAGVYGVSGAGRGSRRVTGATSTSGMPASSSSALPPGAPYSAGPAPSGRTKPRRPVAALVSGSKAGSIATVPASASGQALSASTRAGKTSTSGLPSAGAAPSISYARGGRGGGHGAGMTLAGSSLLASVPEGSAQRSGSIVGALPNGLGRLPARARERDVDVLTLCGDMRRFTLQDTPAVTALRRR
jgi:hypothetical protein